MRKVSIQQSIRKLNRAVFSTYELAQVAGKSLSVTTQSLKYLEREGVVLKIYRGIWVDRQNQKISPYAAVPFLLPRHRAYVSFISALHLHHIVEQIPQVVMLASTAHTKTIKTKIGTFRVHQINSSFFKGFDWYKKTGDFLIAEPEKALVDSLYLSAYKKRQFGYFPELHFPKEFSFKKVRYWISIIPNPKVRKNVEKKIKAIAIKETS